MIKLLLPKLYAPSLLSLTPLELRQRGIKALLLDLDNTLVPRGEEKVDSPVKNWVENLRRQGFKLCVVSNNTHGKGAGPIQELGVPAVFRAVKPFPWAFRRALELLGTRPEETAIVGDQLFTDILGGNLLGLYTILVPSLKGPDFIATRLLVRPVERLVWRWIRSKVPRLQEPVPRKTELRSSCRTGG
ncbi:HAD superfamily (subfamily IIIA) phosphatase, TIGR01668 [Ammonifex degensii KC4]|uniref:HAD superfamily (Subfamily IIIA) phosphatase, TIGR01668 n=1 Tax=Ammonifex degensii (strain DSM 10501 / KC4) TaxID=429009 RepID=C9RC25_AMMDK|nr:YqeG family HAD IIIA-type phosphatase [Ammonifex degensii]ACX51802.1 HAD superfamily (subfamily IIIA) phosphatase, TIGR01668 [Ammonifex degensii KC4]